MSECLYCDNDYTRNVAPREYVHSELGCMIFIEGRTLYVTTWAYCDNGDVVQRDFAVAVSHCPKCGNELEGDKDNV